MKCSLLLLVIALLSVIAASESLAQNPKDTVLARIIYTNSERTAILAKTVGANQVDVLFTSKGSAQVKNLSVLASTKDGKSLLIGGKAVFANGLGGTDSVWAIARLDAPFTNTGNVNLFPPYSFGGAKVLKIWGTDEAQSVLNFSKLLPLGVLSPDEKHWFVTPSKTLAGNSSQWFFHGSFDGKEPIDSVLVSAADPSARANQGFHMSNLTVSDDGSTMYAVTFIDVGSEIPSAFLYSWHPNIGGGSVEFLASNITGAIRGLRTTVIIDSSFAFAFRAIPGAGQNPPFCELALAPNNAGNITFYTFRATGSITTLTPGRTVSRSVLPKQGVKNLQFFTGYTGSTGSPDDDKEVIAPLRGYPNGNGGDMMFSPSGDSLVFVTCDTTATATADASGIYIYDFNTSKVTLVQNDPLKMERQPIFTASVVHPYVPPPPPPYKVGTATIDKTSLDLGSVLIGDPAATATVKLTDPTSSLVIVNFAKIVGPDAGTNIFTVSPSYPPSAFTIQGHTSLTFTVSFTPSAAKTYNDTLEIHYIDSLNEKKKDSIFLVPLTGRGVKKSGGGVQASSPVSFDLSIVPNPFTSSTKITVAAREASSSSLEIRDLLGKDIYSSKALSLGAGEKFTYMLDANALHLAPGAYFVIVRSAGDEVTRQVIYVK